MQPNNFCTAVPPNNFRTATCGEVPATPVSSKGSLVCHFAPSSLPLFGVLDMSFLVFRAGGIAALSSEPLPPSPQLLFPPARHGASWTREWIDAFEALNADLQRPLAFLSYLPTGMDLSFLDFRLDGCL